MTSILRDLLQSFSKAPSSGFYLVFEGIDGSGKTTQVRLLVDFFVANGFEVVQTREPTDGHWGRLIRENFLRARSLEPEEELELFIEDRREHLQQLVLPALRAGKIVIQDRYFFSTLAYQGALGVAPEVILKKHVDFAPLPHRIYFMQLSPEESRRRIEEFRHETPDDFERLESLKAADFLFSSLHFPEWYRLDATLPALQIHEEIKRDLRRHFAFLSK